MSCIGINRYKLSIFKFLIKNFVQVPNIPGLWSVVFFMVWQVMLRHDLSGTEKKNIDQGFLHCWVVKELNIKWPSGILRPVEQTCGSSQGVCPFALCTSNDISILCRSVYKPMSVVLFLESGCQLNSESGKASGFCKKKNTPMVEECKEQTKGNFVFFLQWDIYKYIASSL